MCTNDLQQNNVIYAGVDNNVPYIMRATQLHRIQLFQLRVSISSKLVKFVLAQSDFYENTGLSITGKAVNK